MKISLHIDGNRFSGEPALGTTLAQFLIDLGESEVAPLLERADGKLIATEFTLAHQCHEGRFKISAAPPELSAVTAEELLPSFSGGEFRKFRLEEPYRPEGFQ